MAHSLLEFFLPWGMIALGYYAIQKYNRLPKPTHIAILGKWIALGLATGGLLGTAIHLYYECENL